MFRNHPMLQSGTLHLGTFLVLFLCTKINFEQARDTEPKVDISIIYNKSTDNASHQVKENTRYNEKSPTNTTDAYMSEKNNTVAKQTTKETKTEPKKSQHSPTAIAQTTPKKDVPQKTINLSNLGIAFPKQSEINSNPHTTPNEKLASGEITDQVTGDYVRGIAKDSETLLNTREYVFFSYFKRVKDRLDTAWNTSLHEELEKYFRRGRQLASEHEYTTQIYVTLNHEGGVDRLQILTPSGTKDLDHAAVKAFDKAGPFPNPPKGLLNEAKKFVLRWEFILRT